MVSAPPRPKTEETRRPSYLRTAERLDFPGRLEKVAVVYLGRNGVVRLTRFVPVQADSGTARFDIGAIIRRAQRLRASGIVLVHNHPSGALRASPEDIQVTQDLVDAGAKAGVPLVDHLVFANGEVRSISGQNSVVADVGRHTREHYQQVHRLAHELRQKGERYSSALKRARGQIKGGPMSLL